MSNPKIVYNTKTNELLLILYIEFISDNCTELEFTFANLKDYNEIIKLILIKNGDDFKFLFEGEQDDKIQKHIMHSLINSANYCEFRETEITAEIVDNIFREFSYNTDKCLSYLVDKCDLFKKQ